MMLLLLLLLLPHAAVAGKKGAPETEFVDVPVDSEVTSSGELDALQQLAGSDKMAGKTITQRSVSKDGKSGVITFSDADDGGKRMWKPAYSVDVRGLRKAISTDDAVLVYFFSSADGDHLSRSHEEGVKFEAAAQELAEMDLDVSISLLMFDCHRATRADSTSLLEWGVTAPHAYKLFVNGKPRPYVGSTETAGLVAGMLERAGPASARLESAAELDALLDDPATATTVVVGVFGVSSYATSSARERYVEHAHELRDAGRLRFVETSAAVARQSAVLGNATIDPAAPAVFVCRPRLWLAPGEARYVATTDARSLHRFIRRHAWPLVAPLSAEFVAHAREAHGATKMAIVLLDHERHQRKLRYIIKHVYKLRAAVAGAAAGAGPPEASAPMAFAVGRRRPLDRFVFDRFDRTTVDGKFYSAEDFEREIAQDFTLIVADLTEAMGVAGGGDALGGGVAAARRDVPSANWLSRALSGGSPDSLAIDAWVPFLRGVVDGTEPPVLQGAAAVKAAGLKEMKLGMVGDADAGQEEGQVEPNRRKKRAAGKKGGKRRGKAAGAATSTAKDEV